MTHRNMVADVQRNRGEDTKQGSDDRKFSLTLRMSAFAD